jgi:Putative transposase, YhgA-like
MKSADEPPRDLADRIIRQTLPYPEHLRAFLQQVVPDLAAGFDCDRARPLDRELWVKDWRRREADPPFEIPYRTGVEEILALVYVLIEHQSKTDPLMPLRMLFYAVAYWEMQWRKWEELKPPKPPLRLHPVLPIVLYTGAAPWGSNRTLADLLGEPTAFHAFAPTWQPLFWNLSDRTPQSLLDSGAQWLQMLAVLRATGVESAEFEAVYAEMIRQVQPESEQDIPRWEALVRAVITWGQWRRPAAEREALMVAAAANQTNPFLQKRVEAMSQTIAESLIEEGVVKGQALANRETLRFQLTERFGPLPDTLLERIGTANPDRLNAALRQIFQLKNLEELTL